MTALVHYLRYTLPGIGKATIPPAAKPRWLGPGLLVAVGFVDPGNWATDLQAGARYGYTLTGAVILASLMGWLFQHLSARLALATGRDLASLIRHQFPAAVADLAWLAAELAIIATTMAELLGSAIALQLLLGLPLGTGIGLAAMAGCLVLIGSRHRASEQHEYVVAGLLAVVSVSFLALLHGAHPSPQAAWQGLLHSGSALQHPAMLAMAAGLIGATVMPHNLYLHSGMTASRVQAAPPEQRVALASATEADTFRGLSLATLVNLAILMLAAATLSRPGLIVDSLAHAHQAIAVSLGNAAALVFALALYAAGQSSTLTGMLAGRQIRRGFARGGGLPGPALWLSRGLGTACSLLLVLFVPGLSADRVLVWTQDVLALVLPFALLPLVILVSRRRLMGRFTLSRPMLGLAIAATAVILYLDASQIASLI